MVEKVNMGLFEHRVHPNLVVYHQLMNCVRLCPMKIAMLGAISNFQTHLLVNLVILIAS